MRKPAFHCFAPFAAFTLLGAGLALPSAALAADVSAKGNSHFISQLKQQLAYPEDALSQEVQGAVVVSVQVDQQNNVIGIHMDKSSGNSSLDHAAMEAAKNTSPTWAESDNGVVRAQVDFKL